MYAVVNIAGKQVQVDKGKRLRVPKLNLEEGAKHQFTQVQLVADGEQIHVGRPTLEGAAVDATVLGHGRAKKVIVFKMKRRKKYRRRNGHRQDYTEIQVDDIQLAN
ncbi:MAG: 50S ribosomal protein L21 [Candidatus Latescibacteria bacterium]|nr:50S ribosomal protein L21 [Candidatus Latescibacterota bacterium]